MHQFHIHCRGLPHSSGTKVAYLGQEALRAESRAALRADPLKEVRLSSKSGEKQTDFTMLAVLRDVRIYGSAP